MAWGFDNSTCSKINHSKAPGDSNSGSRNGASFLVVAVAMFDGFFDQVIINDMRLQYSWSEIIDLFIF